MSEDVVARRRDLPGLPAQLRRRQRRRHRRPGRAPGPPAVPGRPRRRRDLVQPLVPLADGRRRLRRGRLPRHRPGVRHPRRGRGADRGGARAGHPDHHRHGAQPQLRPARLVPGGAGRRAGLAGAGAVLVPAGRGELPPNDWQSIFGGPAWTQVARRRSGTCTCSPPSSPTSTGTTRRCIEEFEDILRFWFDRGVDGIRIDSAAAAGQGPGRRARRPATRTPTATRCTRSTGAGGGSPTSTTSRVLIGEVWLPDPERFARYLRPDELHTAFNFDFLGCPWDAGRAARVDRRARWPRTRRSAPRRPGCCPTTTSPATSPGTAGRTPRSASTDRSDGTPDRPGARQPPGPGGGAARPGAARRRLRLPGRGARPAGGRGHPGRAAPGPDVAPLRGAPTPAGTAAGCRCRGRATSRRSGSAPGDAPWLPQPRELEGAHRRGPGRRPGSMLDAVPRRAAHPRASLPRRRHADLAATSATGCSPSPASPA